jgi:hypothetical protein
VGEDTGSTYGVGCWLFLRCLGVVYLIAFVSLGSQITGLVGVDGILPAGAFLQAVRSFYPGLAHWHLVPSLFWLSSSDAALHGLCLLGAGASALLISNVAPRVVLPLLWLSYLSLVAIGQDFLSFQWDALLLEAGLLAVFLAPGHGLRSRGPDPAPALAVLLVWWLLFRLTVGSGIVKLTWGDVTWRDLTALDYHFWTQPLPTWTAWYASQLPEWLKRLSVLATFGLELVTPLFMFGPRRARWVALAGVIGLQTMIGATGNYTFFNLLTVGLALPLLDDAAWSRLLPGALMARFAGVGREHPVASLPATVCALILLALSAAKFGSSVRPAPMPTGFARVFGWVEPFRSINSYGLFRVMTTSRHEIVIEGSDDGRSWQAYGFEYKPGDVGERPRFVEPLQPRLDWQMWFAALGAYQDTPWLESFLTRLLQGSRPVLRLLGENPFPAHAPRFLRAELYDYRFATPAEHATTGAWWTRRLLGIYSPVLSLGG